MKRETPYQHGIPESTSAPLVTAFGVTLVAAGLVTNLWVMVGGAVIALVGLWQWFGDVFPGERLEEIPAPNATQRRWDFAVEAIQRAGTRGIYPERAHPWRSGILGGIFGGVAMAVVASIWGLVEHSSVWLPINLLAGCVMPSVGGADETALALFNPAWIGAACMIHGALSVACGVLYALALPIAPQRPILAGSVALPVIVTGLVWPTLTIVNPALDGFISWPWFVGSQVAFGVVCGWWVAGRGTVEAHAGRSIVDRMGVHRGRRR